MTNHLLNFSNTLRERLVSMAIFAILFAALGYYIPRIYFQYFDTTNYYRIESPIKMPSSPYKSCGIITIRLHRVALTDLKGEATINLFLTRDNSKEKISEGKRQMVITKGEADITTFWNLPCGIQDGIYYYDGVVTYQINGITKQSFFSTETFLVKK